MNYFNNFHITSPLLKSCFLAAHVDSPQVSNQSWEAIAVSRFYLLGGLNSFLIGDALLKASLKAYLYLTSLNPRAVPVRWDKRLR